MSPDEKLERRIYRAFQNFNHHGTRPRMLVMYRLIKRRSPQQVAHMEALLGLRKCADCGYPSETDLLGYPMCYPCAYNRAN